MTPTMPWGGADAREPYRVKFRSWLPRLFGHECVTLRRTIYVRGRRLTAYLHAHEHRHVQQWASLGMWRFLFAYLRDLLRYGYANHPLEKDAHAYGVAHEADFGRVYDESLMRRR